MNYNRRNHRLKATGFSRAQSEIRAGTRRLAPCFSLQRVAWLCGCGHFRSRETQRPLHRQRRRRAKPRGNSVYFKGGNRVSLKGWRHLMRAPLQPARGGPATCSSSSSSSEERHSRSGSAVPFPCFPRPALRLRVPHLNK